MSQTDLQVDFGSLLHCSKTAGTQIPHQHLLEAGARKSDTSGGIDAAAGRQLVTPYQATAMTQDEERELRATLARLMQEHRDLDAAIEALENAPGRDRLQIQRLKKRKLQLRDRITFIEDQLTPDIIA
jgi:hypothetical protein